MKTYMATMFINESIKERSRWQLVFMVCTLTRIIAYGTCKDCRDHLRRGLAVGWINRKSKPIFPSLLCQIWLRRIKGIEAIRWEWPTGCCLWWYDCMLAIFVIRRSWLDILFKRLEGNDNVMTHAHLVLHISTHWSRYARAHWLKPPFRLLSSLTLSGLGTC